MRPRPPGSYPRRRAPRSGLLVLATLSIAFVLKFLHSANHAAESVGRIRLKLSVSTTGNEAAGVEAGGTDAVATAQSQPTLRSYFARWVRQDFATWRRSGITKAMVDAAASMHWSYQVSSIRQALPSAGCLAAAVSSCLALSGSCTGDTNICPCRRFQVINGTLWAVYPKHSRYYSRGEAGRRCHSPAARPPWAALATGAGEYGCRRGVPSLEISPRPRSPLPAGYYPSKLGKGWASAKAQVRLKRPARCAAAASLKSSLSPGDPFCESCQPRRSHTRSSRWQTFCITTLGRWGHCGRGIFVALQCCPCIDALPNT